MKKKEQKQKKHFSMKIDHSAGGLDVFLASLLTGVLVSFKNGSLSDDEAHQYLLSVFSYEMVNALHVQPDLKECFLSATQLSDTLKLDQELFERDIDRLLDRCAIVITEKSESAYDYKGWSIVF